MKAGLSLTKLKTQKLCISYFLKLTWIKISFFLSAPLANLYSFTLLHWVQALLHLWTKCSLYSDDIKIYNVGSKVAEASFNAYICS